MLIRGITFVPFRLHEGLWRYTSVWDMQRIVAAVVLSTGVFYILMRLILQIPYVPRSALLIDSVLLIGFMGGLRLTRRILHGARRIAATRRILIYGAGDAGELIVRDMKHNPFYGCDPVGFVDDDRTKVGNRIHGVPVLGTREELHKILDAIDPDELLIAMPREERSVVRQIVRTLQPFKLRISILPSLPEVMSGKAMVTYVRPLAIEDLLARPKVQLDKIPVRKMVEGKRVLVTGAGGSIGSELCRQLVELGPSSLAMVERYENGLYTVATELSDRGHAGFMRTFVADITDRRRVRRLMTDFSPEIIFHAAAHKHVPMMELNPCEAVKNNVEGTRIMIEEAVRCHADRFVLISSDKAVNPTSVMGATKRVAELCVQAAAGEGLTNLCVVRFGNVLASSGSVVPRFLAQIKMGGPVTVTDPEIRRYFMLIPEAVQLVVQAAAHAEPGTVYVLEMGEQIRIADMARNLIRLAGYVPDEEIKIEYMGLRPGEKLYEELVGNDETSRPSSIPEVHRVVATDRWSAAELAVLVEKLEEAARSDDNVGVLRVLQSIIPTFSPTTELASEKVAFPSVGDVSEGEIDPRGIDIVLH